VGFLGGGFLGGGFFGYVPGVPGVWTLGVGWSH